MLTATNFKELAAAVASNPSKIEISGDITKGTVKIVSTGAVSWAVAFGAIGIAYAAFALAPPTGGTTSTLSAIAAPAAVASIGIPATVAALAITTGTGSLSAIKKLRSYKVESYSEGVAILVKK